MADDYDNAEAVAAQFQDCLNGLGMQDGAGRGGRGRGVRGGGGGGRGRGRGGGSSSSGQQRERTISHALSRLLRHQAAAAGIPLDAQGYARLDLVLQWGPLRSAGATVAEVRRVVATNDKQRFHLRGADGDVDGDGDDDEQGADAEQDASRLYIRANQGHSIASVASDAGLLTPLTDAATAPTAVCHGTYLAAWPAIEAAGGLHRMGRNHVHFGCRGPDDDGGRAIVPGVRRDAQLLVFVDVRRALRQGDDGDDGDNGAPPVAGRLCWWRAANGVVLTEGDADGRVPTRLFSRVVLTAAGVRALRAAGVQPPTAAAAAAEEGGECLLWRNGQKLADLPHDVLAGLALPNGKRPADGPGRGRRGGRGRGRGRGGEAPNPA